MRCGIAEGLGLVVCLKGEMASNNFKVEFKKFDGKKNFTLWQQQVKDLLVQQWIYIVLVRERSKKIHAEDWKKLEEIAFSTIKMYLTNQVLLEVSMETTVRDL